MTINFAVGDIYANPTHYSVSVLLVDEKGIETPTVNINVYVDTVIFEAKLVALNITYELLNY